MELKPALDRVASFIIDPANKDRQPKMQKIAWAATVLLCIGTVGISLGLSALWRKIRHVDHNDTHEKIGQTFHRIFSKNRNETPTNNSIQEAERRSTGNEDETTLTESSIIDIEGETTLTESSIIELSEEAPAQPSPERVAQQIYDRREELWAEAGRQASGDEQKTPEEFKKILVREFIRNKIFVAMFTRPENVNALNTLFQDARIRTALATYAKDFKLHPILDRHMQFLAQGIYNRRAELTARAAEKAGDNISRLIALLTHLIRTEMANEGRSLSEVLNNQEAINIFRQSECLMLVLYCYAKMKQEEQEARPSAAVDPKVQNAVRLAQADAAGPGVVTRLGFKEFADDLDHLKRAARGFLVLNHPDKNPDADLARVQDATEIVNMLKDGVYLEYKKALDLLRR